MPRGFLVKRAGKSTGGYTSYRQRRNSADDDRQSVNSDSGSEPEHLSSQYGSPDSGFSQSPINLTFKPSDSLPENLKTRPANTTQQVNRLSGLVHGNAPSDKQILNNSFKREQLQIKFKLLDNYGFGCSTNSGRPDPNEGVINYSKSKVITSPTRSTTSTAVPTKTSVDSENNVNIANTIQREITANAPKISPPLPPTTKPNEAGQPTAPVTNSVFGHSRERDDLMNHNNRPLGLLCTLDRSDLTTHQRVLPPSSVIASVSRGAYQEQIVNHLKRQQQQFHNGLLAAAAAAKVSVASLASSSPPLSVGAASPPYTSPLYYSAFDRLSVSSPSGRHHHQQRQPHAGEPRPISNPGAASSTSSGSARSSPAPSSPNKRRASGDCLTPSKAKVIKKPKSARKITFEEDKSSPVSGTIIKDWDDDAGPDNTKKVVCGDIDSNLNIVEATPEARAELDKIENKIGDYVCQLCKEFYDDAFQLASHRCPRIVHIEYRCPECDKVFNCPANLASHRRWHKPRPNGNTSKSSTNTSKTVTSDGLVPGMTVLGRQTPSPNNPTGPGDIQEAQFACSQCGKKFKRQAYLKKHQANHVNSSTGQSQTGGLPSVKPKHPQDQFQPRLPSPSAQHAPATVLPIEIRPLEGFDCKYCPSSFNNSPGLTRHINKCHPSENRQVILLQMPVSPRTC